MEYSYGAIIISNGKFLASKSPAGHWGVPKGHIVKDESPVDCMKRECFEEVGLTTINKILPRIFFHSYTIPHKHVKKRVGLFVIETSQEQFKKTEEMIDYELLPMNEFKKKSGRIDFISCYQRCSGLLC